MINGPGTFKMPDNIKKIRMAYNPEDFLVPQPPALSKSEALEKYEREMEGQKVHEILAVVQKIRQKYEQKIR